MALRVGIVGLPNVGKSTLFNAITNSRAEAANYPFATIEPNHGVVELIDERLQAIAKIVNPQKIIYATLEFIDIAGLVAGASKGEGLGNKFLANIREVDAIIHVVRCFENSEVIHVHKSVDPKHDAQIINLELQLADMQTMTNVISRIGKKATTTQAKQEVDLAMRVLKLLESESPLRLANFTPEEHIILKQWQLLTLKPVLYVANVAEAEVTSYGKSLHYKALLQVAHAEHAEVIALSAKVEEEISLLSSEERPLFISELNLGESGLNKVVKSAFKLLGLYTYFTAGVKEVRAWTFKKGMTAPQCAGVIHSDFERGFIKAQVIKYADFIHYHGEHGAQAAGKVRIEGKDYLVHDADVLHFKFNVR